jgi:hypothetical protein
MDVAVYQLISYISLTAASVFVSATSAFVGWRQIHGWRPTFFVTGVGVSSIAGSTYTYEATVTMEIWNRRKYPIAIAPGSSIDFRATEVGENLKTDGWQKWRNTMCYYGDKIRIEPLSHHELVVKSVLRAERKDIADNWPVEIKYFDPPSNKEITLKGIAHYKQPVCTENLIRVDDVMESPKLAE